MNNHRPVRAVLACLAVLAASGSARAAAVTPSPPIDPSIMQSAIVTNFVCAETGAPRIVAWETKHHPDWTQRQGEEFQAFLDQVHHCPLPLGIVAKKRSYSTLRARAIAGDLAAQTELGVAYESDLGHTPDFLKVLECDTDPQVRGPYVGAYWTGFITYPRCLPHDYPQAIRWLRAAASRGYAPAERQLGLLYEQDYGVPVDYPVAFSLLHAAARQGDKAAGDALLLMYEHGHGPSAAFPDVLAKILRSAADPRDPLQIPAQAALGMMYATGQGVPQDYATSETWFSVAFNSMSNVTDRFALGTLIMHGMDMSAKHLTRQRVTAARAAANAWSAAHHPRPRYYLRP